ncbi:ATP-binding cassette domain-containing protein [Nonomuraea wenchangensis]|uniref:ABC-2 type transport system ATP-binding protein n=1 Tax=Nonomuraea wenchangensis TaxID=568860 RepID=A0A1I0FLK8_9ACTN|nr:ATP-binding cassette domain-containing protein [Nonomuraea wenchangensis]SET58928.1 ABC-2 type transport system ATP-binding protein [Nonomuraea wenchangensis]
MIHARALTRTFKVKKERVEAVRGLDLDVEAGQLTAFLGPNGAGKSTTLRILTTLLPPTSGTATVAGHDVATEPAAVRARIGYVGQRSSAGEEFRVRDELVTQGRCYGLRPREAAARADELLDLLDLAPLAKRTPGTLSGGQRRRLDLAIGLVHRPDLLFLDEPSTGLDPKSRAEIWQHILRLREAYGTTLFLTTHYLEEADTMAERVVIIDNGRVIADGTPEQLKNDLAGDLVTLTTGTADDAARAAAAVGGTAEGTTVRLRVPNAAAAMPECLRTLDAKLVEVVTAETTRPTLDDVFLALTGRSLADDDIPA